MEHGLPTIISALEQCSVVPCISKTLLQRNSSRCCPNHCHCGNPGESHQTSDCQQLKMGGAKPSSFSHDILICSLADSSFDFSQSVKKPYQLVFALESSSSNLAVIIALSLLTQSSCALCSPPPPPLGFQEGEHCMR